MHVFHSFSFRFGFFVVAAVAAAAAAASFMISFFVLASVDLFFVCFSSFTSSAAIF